MIFNFYVDDNIYVFRDLTRGNYGSVFEHEYLKMFKELHEKYGLKVQLNVFYKTDDFDLSEMTDKFRDEWKANSHWLKFAFHAEAEFPDDPYINADYDTVDRHCKEIHKELRRFAGEECISYSPTIHFMEMTKEGCRALLDNGITKLSGMFRTPNNPMKKYYHGEDKIKVFDDNVSFADNGITFTNLDMVINCHPLSEIEAVLSESLGRELIQIMIHEQYFYKFYQAYQPDYKDKVEAAVRILKENGYNSDF